MVLGLRTKNRKSPSVQVDYLINIQEIKPWPPSQSLRTLRAVVIQWEHGDRTSGSTNQVVPSLGTGSGVGDGRIEFNESFRLPVTLLRELSVKGGDGDSFQKNCVEFNLYEPRRDKTMKGQLLGTAIVDLADYGIVKETLSINAPINCKRSYRNTAQPLLFLKIQLVEKGHTRSLSRDSLMREPSMDRSAAESVSSLMNEKYAEEAEIASFTDDDISSHSSQAVSSLAVESNGSSPPQNEQNGSENLKDSIREAKNGHLLPSKLETANSDKEADVLQMSKKVSSSRSSSVDLSSDLAWITRKFGAHGIQATSSSVVPKETEKEHNTNKGDKFDMQPQDIQQQGVNGGSDVKKPIQPITGEYEPNGSIDNETLNSDSQVDDKLRFSNSVELHANGESNENNLPHSMRGVQEAVRADDSHCASADNENREKHQENEKEQEMPEEKWGYMEDMPLNSISLDSVRSQILLGSDEPSTGGDLGGRKYAPTVDRSKHVKSVRSALDSNRSGGSVRNNLFVSGNSQNGVKGSSSNERKDAKVYPKDTRNNLTESKILQLEGRVKMLEGELREAAALEVGLYSVVAEHGSSTNKVHAPARRLSRLYLHACKETSRSRRGSAAKSAVSGLVLVAKACGNDVPRLTFWLSNSIVLRAIVSKSFEEQQLPVSAEPITRRTGDQNKKNISPLRWESFPTNGSRYALHDSLDDWEDPRTFTNALERVESWIFSRIIESIWWQTLTPHMQSGAARAIRRSMGSELSKVYRRTSSSSGDEQVNFSLELWKKAFKDACERICPVRAAGHECGCLPVLSRLIMEQCVARLDVAMFNAILRESADEIPTDPVSDPISDSEVLPIPAGKASFGAGAQLKNAIGNWSRWLTDLFGIDDDDSLEEDNCTDNSGDERREQDASLKSFHLLNALSDLMMLPKDMLLSRTIRKEVCPLFGPLVIRRVLNAFAPDEFCPDPIPRVVLEALDLEDAFEAEEDSVVNFPCTAAAICYVPPSASYIPGISGDVDDHSKLRRSGSSVLKKSYTSDDELEELDSPLSSIIDGLNTSPSSTKPRWTPKENRSQNAVRYRLLREVWMKNL